MASRRVSVWRSGRRCFGEAPDIGEGLQPAGEVQLSRLEGVLQRCEEDAAEVA